MNNNYLSCANLRSNIKTELCTLYRIQIWSAYMLSLRHLKQKTTITVTAISTNSSDHKKLNRQGLLQTRQPSGYAFVGKCLIIGISCFFRSSMSPRVFCLNCFCLNDAIQCSLNNSLVFQKWRACLLFEWCYTVFLEQLFGVSEVACVSSVWMMLYSVPWTTLWCFRSGVSVFCLNDAIQCSLNNSLVFQKWRACLLFEWCYTVFLEQLFGVSEVACLSSVWMMLYSVPWTTFRCFRSGACLLLIPLSVGRVLHTKQPWTKCQATSRSQTRHGDW